MDTCYIEGCVIDGICGCLIAGTCYREGVENPENQCQFCHTGSSRTAWTNYADGKECNDSDPCTRNDKCSFQTAECAGTDFSSEPACTELSPCVSETYCDGNDCKPIFYDSSQQCYTNTDFCDYPDLYCSGNHAECRYCITDELCTSVTPENSPRPVPGVDLRVASIFVYKTGTSDYLDVVYASNGNGYLMLTSTTEIKIRFQNYTVPCDDVTLYWQIVTTTTGDVVYSQVDAASSDGTLDIEVALTFENGGEYRILVDARNVRNVSSFDQSEDILVDVTDPLIGEVYDGESGGDRDYQASTTSIAAHWDANSLIDEESGLNTSSYQIAVGTVAGGTEISDYVYANVMNGEVTGLDLQDAVKYFVTLNVYNLAGLVSTRSSNGVTVDITPPVLGKVTIVNNTIDTSEIDYIVIPTRRVVAVLDGCEDPESGILEIGYRFCAENVNDASDTSCNDDRVYDCLDPNSCLLDIELLVYEDSEILDDDVLISGYSYTLVLIVVNGAGASGSLFSNAVIVDYSPPTAGTVLDGVSANAEVDFQADNTSIRAVWFGSSDQQSSLDYCQLAVFQDYGFPGEEIVSPFVDVSFEGQTTVTNLVLQTGTRYYPVLKCYNKAGLFTASPSDGVLVDAFPPTPTEIKDIRYEEDLLSKGTDEDFQASLDGIKSKWKVFSAASGLEFCNWSLNKGESTPIPPYSSTYTLTTQLAEGGFYFASVQCTSFSGLSTTAESDGMTPDSTEPVPGNVYDLCPDFCGVDTDISYSSSADILRFRWEDFVDDESGIDYYDWNYDEECSGFFLLLQFQNVGNQTQATANVTLVQNTVYCVTVRAVNRAGLKTESKSNGVHIDHTPPTEVAVNDGTSSTTDIDSQDNSTSVSVTWSLITDMESYISDLEVGLGTEPNEVDTVSLTPIGNETTTFTFYDLNLEVDQVYFAKVCATNGAKLTTCVHSDGVLIEAPPPFWDSGVEIGVVPPPIRYQTGDGFLSSYWYKFPTTGQPIEEFAFGIGTAEFETDVMKYVRVGTNLSHGAPVHLMNGGMYYATVQVSYSSGDDQKPVSSYGVIVDTTPPIASQTVSIVIVGGNAVEASWTDFEERESFVRYYKWAVGTTSCGAEVHRFTNIGRKTNAFRKVDFISGLKYYVTVVALNSAGLTSTACSEGILFDGSPPVTGTVRDGPDVGGKDLDYQSSEKSVAMNWRKFTDSESGIKQCFVGIGTSSDDADELDFKEVPPDITFYEFRDVVLQPGTKYFFLVKCLNAVGLTSQGSSDGVIIDASPPTTGTVTTLQYQSSVSEMQARWENFSDSESPIDRYLWAIGSQDNEGDVLTFQSVYLNEDATATGLSLVAGVIYYVTVECWNRAGLLTKAVSDGLIVDTSPPNHGIVYDGGNGDIDWHDSTTGIESHWSNFDDPESGIVSYKWYLGTYKGGCQAASVFNIEPETTYYNCYQCVFLVGEIYYITVVAINGAGLKVNSSSDGFTVDLTAPTSGILSDPKWATNDVFQFMWTGGKDYESGPPECVLHAVSEEGTSTTYQLRNTSGGIVFVEKTYLPEAVELTLSVNCTNRAGLSSLSSLISVDASPPVAGLIQLLYYDSVSITIEWTLFRDPDSALTDMELHFNTVGLSDTVLTSVASKQYTYFPPDGTYVIGAIYNVSAKALSTVGLKSPAVIETYNFSQPQSSLDSSYCCSIELSLDNVTLTTTWSWRYELDDESTRLGYRYRYSIGTVPGGTQILQFTYVGTTREAVCSDCVLLQGAEYYVTLHASTDNFQTFSSRQSKPFLIDTTPPFSAGPVLDGLTRDKDYYAINESFTATWIGLHDPESSVQYCNVSIIEEGIGSIVWTMDNNPFPSVSGSVSVWIHAHTYRTNFLCVSGNGLSSEKESDGFTVDETPPAIGTVTMEILNNWRRLVNISGSWSRFRDDESDIASYGWSLVEAGENANEPFTLVGTETSFTATANLTAGAWYQVIVIATNGVGLQSSATSPATVYDLTKPIASYVYDGDLSYDVDYVVSAIGFSSTWDAMTDPETAIVDCFWYVGREPNGSNVLSPQSVEVGSGSGRCDDCLLSNGVKYYSTLTCYNEAGLQAVVSSDGVLVDFTPPIASRVYSGKGRSIHLQYQSHTDSTDCTWEEFSDEESEIDTYTVCLGQVKGNCSEGKADGLPSNVTTWTLSGLNLEDKKYYFCTVKAQNRAGLNQSASSDGVKIDKTDPIAGTVVDSSDGISSCRSDNSTTIVTWSHFHDFDSDIVEYEWGVGTMKGTDDVISFESVGLKETATSNATMPIGMVYVSVRATDGAGLQVVGVSDGKLVYEFGEVPQGCVLFQ